MGWQLVESRRQRQQQHVWLKLRQGLVQTLDELYSMCEDEPSMADSAVRYLEHTLHHFKQVWCCNATGALSSLGQAKSGACIMPAGAFSVFMHS